MENNVITSPIVATPTVFLSDGVSIPLSPMTLGPGKVATLNLKEALEGKGIDVSKQIFGYLVVDYVWPWNALCVSIKDTDPERSTIFVYTLDSSIKTRVRGAKSTVASLQNNVLEGFWWKAEPNVKAFMALSNSLTLPIHARIRWSDEAGNEIGAREIAVNPHNTMLLDASELDALTAKSGGVRVIYDGPSDGFIVSGGLVDEKSGYSARMPLHFPPVDDHKSASQEVTSLDLMQGEADPQMMFPKGTSFTPYSIVKNISTRPLQITPTLSWMEGPVPRSSTSASLVLDPGETRRLDLRTLIQDAGLRAATFNLTLLTNGQSRALLEAAGSVDASYNYVFEVASTATTESVAKVISYWSTANGDDTMVTLRNPTIDPQDLKIRLEYSGEDGQYTWPIHLNPGETHSFNISQILHNGELDEAGHFVPAAVHEGRAIVMGAQAENQHIIVQMDSSIYNVAKATCGNTYCKTCAGAVTSWIYDSSFSMSRGPTGSFGFVVQYNNGVIYDHTSKATWTSSNSNVGTVSSGTLTPVAVGSISLDANDGTVPDYSDSCYSSNPDAVCPTDTGADGGSSGTIGDQTPIIDGIDPSTWQSGKTTQVTITGQYFGTAQPTLNLSPNAGISVSLSSYNDSQVVANVTVASGVPTEDVAVTLTSNGYGSGFQSGGSGASATSNPANARVNAPTNAPEVTVIGWINASAVTLPSGENATLQSDLAAQSYACVTDLISWSASGHTDLKTTADDAYALAALILYSANPAPPSSINPQSQKTAGQYRLINDFGGSGSGFHALGNSPNPCSKIPLVSPIITAFGSAQPDQNADGKSGTSPSGSIYQISEGRVGTIGQAVNTTLTGNTTPYVWSVVQFDSSGNPTTSNHSVFPSFNFYVNGTIVQPSYAQISPNIFAQKNQSYELLPSQIP